MSEPENMDSEGGNDRPTGGGDRAASEPPLPSPGATSDPPPQESELASAPSAASSLRRPASSSAPPSRHGSQWGRRWRRSEPLRRRLALGALVGSFGGVVLSLLDGTWARRGIDPAPALSTTLLVDAGLLVPLTLVVGLLIGAASWVVHPRAEPSIGGLLERLRDGGAGRPADHAAFVPLAALGLFAWATFSAQLARVLLALEASPLVVGAAIACGSAALALLTIMIVLALTPPLRQRLAIWRNAWSGWVDPAVTLSLAVLLVALLIGYGILRGTVSGEGGLFGIYGIFKRQELDLRAPSALLSLAVAVYLAPPLLGWLRPYHAALVALLPLALTLSASATLNSNSDLGRVIERGAPVAARSLALLRKLGDRDGDGASRWFGGGDCDDSNAAIGPAVDDVPDNGIDEDCSGTDLSFSGLKPTASATSSSSSSAKPSRLKGLPAKGNLVLITIDTLRYDMGFMGYKRAISPHLDALAKRSAVFEKTYALASYTGKSVGPMLIGKYGVETHRNWGHFNTFSKEDTFVAERIQRAGIRTISVQGHRYFGKYGGLERGFDELDLSAAPPEGAKWATDTTVTSATITDASIRLLDTQPADGRFFLWVHYLDPHADYKAHPEVPAFGSAARDLYDSEVAFTDLHVGRLLNHIGKASWAKRTSIIVTSDHGEAFNEHKMWRHGVELWEVLIRVPLIIHVPGAAALRVKPRRSLIDLVPTMLELLRLPLPPSREAADAKSSDFISGQSLVGEVLAIPGQRPPKRDILVDMPAGPYNEARRAFIKDDLKLIISRGAQKELFDLATDPGERKNIWRKRRKDIEAHYALAKSKLRAIEVTGKRK